MAKALLLVVGGRGFPDILALLCVKPELVVIVTSEEGWGDEAKFRKIAERLPQMMPVPPTIRVKSYELEEIKQVCINTYNSYSSQGNWDWTFSIGSCPKIMGIAAYEVAISMNVPCIYMDPGHDKIISLVRDIGVNPHNFFHMDVKKFMSIYHREPESFSPETLRYRDLIEGWTDVAQLMALSPHTSQFIQVMRDKKVKDGPQPLPDALRSSLLIKNLEKIGAIEITDTKHALSCAFLRDDYARFLGTGDWLEIYTWDRAKSINIVDHCEWGYKIRDAVENELDVALTYKAQLIIVECKTGSGSFKLSHLSALDSKANILGGPYTTRILVTNESHNRDNYTNCKKQAEHRRTVVYTAEDLPNLDELLKKQVIDPTYPRI